MPMRPLFPRATSGLLVALMLSACSREPAPPPSAAASPAVPAPLTPLTPRSTDPNPAADAHPSPELSSRDVVRYQLLALQHADQPAPNAGIEIAFRFASPQNRQHTGPIERFITIVRAPGYAPMIHCDRFEISDGDEVEVDGRRLAQHLVIIHAADGSTPHYLFQLRRQPTAGPGEPANEYADCWMVESVMPVRTLPPTPPADLPPPATDPGRIAA